MSKIIVLQGVPASGKSTWAREFVKGKEDWIIVSRDSIRESRGNYWIPSQEDFITDIEIFYIKSAIAHKFNIIIDATNLNPKTIKKWKKIAENHKYEIEFKEFKITLAEAIDRDRERERSVGETVVKKFFKQYYPEEYSSYQNEEIRISIPFDNNKKNAIIIDLDGTVALRTNRGPFDFKKCSDDSSYISCVRMVQFCINAGLIPIFVSGRDDSCYFESENWIRKHIMYNTSDINMFELHMRKTGDKRKDAIVKKEIYKGKIEEKYNIMAVFDDRNQVVQMWRHELNLLTLQVWEGDF